MTEETNIIGDDAAIRADLQDLLRTVTAERDRNLFEKNEIINKANAAARERDELRAKLTELQAERDQLSANRDEAAQKHQDAARALDAASAELARLREIVEASPNSDALTVLWRLIQQKTAALLAWVRGKIPEGSPMLPWFDKTVDIVAKVGCMAVTAADKFVRWAYPQVVALTRKGLAEVEKMLAKK